jgi:hypothetical protein
MSHHGGKGYPCTQQIRSERRERAEQVAQESGYSKLSTAEKLARVQAFIAVPGNGAAAKQLVRLEALLIKESQPKVQTTKEKASRGVGPLDTSARVRDDSEKQFARKGNKASK